MTSSHCKLYAVTRVDGFLCVVSISVGECLSVTTTRAISNVAREEASKCSVLSAAVSPDGQVLFLLDEGVGQVIRLELESGNCRSFAKDLSFESLYCKLLQPIKINPENFQTKLLDSPSLQTMSFSITLMTAL